MQNSTKSQKNNQKASIDVSKYEYLFERVKLGIDVHPSEIELLELETIAKELDPDIDFGWRGCQNCVNDMIRFIYVKTSN